LDQSLKFLLFSFDIDGITLEIVMLLLLKLMVQFGIELLDDIVKLSSLLFKVSLLSKPFF